MNLGKTLFAQLMDFLPWIALPMTRHQAFGNVGGTQVNAGHAGYLPASINAASAWSAFGVTKA